jgi:hypothetical protein
MVVIFLVILFPYGRVRVNVCVTQCPEELGKEQPFADTSISNDIFEIRYGLEVKSEVQIGVEGMSTQMNTGRILPANICRAS